MRRAILILAALAATISCQGAFAADLIETRSVVVPLADGWHERGGSSPISATGPDQELMQLTVVAARTSAEHPDLARSLESAEASAIGVLTSNAREMVVIAPLKSFSIPNGTHANNLIFQSKDGSQVLLGAVLRGPSSVVLATIEGPTASGNRLGEAFTQLLAIRWK